jgi:hypothetical protein
MVSRYERMECMLAWFWSTMWSQPSTNWLANCDHLQLLVATAVTLCRALVAIATTVIGTNRKRISSCSFPVIHPCKEPSVVGVG